MRILQRVPTGKKCIVQMILNFIAYADPKLDISSFREALSVPEKTGKDDVLDSSSIIRESSIMRLCRSLIRKSNDGRYYEFAHFSVKEFLEGVMKTLPGFEKFQVSESICELLVLLAKQCLKYLLFRDFSSLPTREAELKDHVEMRNKQYPFYFYAAVCWPVFAKPHWVDAGLVDLARRLLQPKKTGNFIAWALELVSFVAFNQEFYFTNLRDALDEIHLQHMLRLLPLVIDKSFTTLHMAAALSLEGICSGLIREGADLDQTSGFGCPLHCAVQGLWLAFDHDDELSYIDLYYECDYWRGNAISPGFGREETIRLLLKSGATHHRACSGRFAGQTLVTVALEVAYWMENLSAINVFLEAGHGVEEEDLIQFRWFRQNLVEHEDLLTEPDGCDIYGLERLILCLGSMIDKSAAHYRLCQTAWSLAIDIGCEFVQDVSIVDTRISLSQDALAKRIFKLIREADTETLIESLKDPRADIANMTSDDNESVFEEWLLNFDIEPSLQDLNVLKVLLSGGIEVDRPNDQGLLPVHMLAKTLTGEIDDDDCCEALRDIIRDFIRKGTGCIAKSRSNQNVFHLGLKSIGFIKAVLEAETNENTLTALRTQDDNEHTPIILALQQGHEDVALLLLETSNCDLKSLRSSASVHALCVAEGTHRAFNFLLHAGVTLDTCSTDVGGTTILHHVGPKTSKDFVLQLVQMFPHGLLFRNEGKLPLDAYLQNCIDAESCVLDSDVVQLLALPRSEDLAHEDKKMGWESLALSVRNAVRPEYKTMRIYEIQKENTSKAIAILLALGFLQSYEAVTKAPGILPLLESSRGGLDDLWPLSIQSIYEILEQTIFWESLRGAAEILGLLRAAVISADVELVELLLEHGVSVHQRIDEMSALEVACLKPAETSDKKQVFTLLLNHADASRLDEINPHQRQQKGLIHYLAGRGKKWQLEEFIKRGADVNLRTNVHIPAQPAIVQHLFEGSLESARTLLENEANPTMTDCRGMDAAVAAAFQGDIAFLHELHIQIENWQLNWGQTVNNVRLQGVGGGNLHVTGCNALHAAAAAGQCDVLRFYCDTGLLTNLNSVSDELLTPMHLAAFSGHVDAVKFLYSQGGGLNLKSADGSLPLHLAVRNGHINVVKFLVESGSTMDTDNRGLSPMAYAMQLQNQSILDCLGATKQRIDYQIESKQHDKDVAHAFEQALIRGDIEYCDMLRSQGFPLHVDLPGQRGRSALMLAIENVNGEPIKWLLTHDVKGTGKALNMKTGQMTPLHAIVMRPALNDILPLLLQKYESEGSPVIAETPSPICIAIRGNNNPGLKLLLDHVGRHETANS